jgi:hypothetical protein
MYKDWNVISQEKDMALRFLLTTATDTRILQGLEKGFPEFFGTEEQPLRIPLSVIKEWREEGDADVPLLETVLEHFGIPHFRFGEGLGIGYPEEWKKILGRKSISINGGKRTYKKLLYLEWRGQRCLVADYTDQGEMIILVPEQFIDVAA